MDQHHGREHSERHPDVAVERGCLRRCRTACRRTPPRAPRDRGVAMGQRVVGTPTDWNHSARAPRPGAPRSVRTGRSRTRAPHAERGASRGRHRGHEARRPASCRADHAAATCGEDDAAARAGRSTTRRPATTSARRGAGPAARRLPSWPGRPDGGGLRSASDATADDLGGRQRRRRDDGVQARQRPRRGRAGRGRAGSIRRRTNAHQAPPTDPAAAGAPQHRVVMMKPLSTKNMSTPMEPPWKNGEYQESQCSDQDGADRERADAVEVVETSRLCHRPPPLRNINREIRWSVW